jgi:hypothetical protein
MNERVFVNQREYAVVERGCVVGSDEATSCVVLCVTEVGTGRTFLAHIDAEEQAEQAGELLDAHLRGACSAWMVGGAEERGAATVAALRHVLASRGRVEPPVCLAGRGCRIAAGDAASFAVLSDWGDDRGPFATERSSRWLLAYDGSLQCCYEAGEWRSSPQLQPPDATEAARYAECASLSDGELLLLFSTTPDEEGPRFLPALRSTLRLAVALAESNTQT